MPPMLFSGGWFVLILTALSVLASSAPANLEPRQTWTGTTSREFSLYGCRPVIFIYARETIGPGNLVSLPCFHLLPGREEQRLTEVAPRVSGSDQRYRID